MRSRTILSTCWALMHHTSAHSHIMLVRSCSRSLADVGYASAWFRRSEAQPRQNLPHHTCSENRNRWVRFAPLPFYTSSFKWVTPQRSRRPECTLSPLDTRVHRIERTFRNRVPFVLGALRESTHTTSTTGTIASGWSVLQTLATCASLVPMSEPIGLK